MNEETLIRDAFDSIVNCDEKKALLVLKKAADSGMDLLDILIFGYSAGIDNLNERFSEGEIVLNRMLASFRVFKLIIAEFEKMSTAEIEKWYPPCGLVAGAEYHYQR